MKISASIYSNKERPLLELTKELDQCHIDYFHVDCNDDPSVFEDITKIREISTTPIDLHIITSHPENYFDLLVTHKIELVTFQYENFSGKVIFPTIPGTSFGLAIISDTPLEVFEEYQDQCDFVLIMTTTPGQSGGKFRKDNFRKIRNFRNKYPGKKIHVDGGVNDEVGFIMRMLGVNSVVSGSYLVKHPSIGTALLHLKSSIIHSDYKIRDFMIDLADTPHLVSGKYRVRDVIQMIEDYRQGFSFVVDGEGKLIGLSSNADVRRGLLQNVDNFNNISVADITNSHPVRIKEESTISDMLKLVKSEDFLISFLPVVDQEDKLTGCITFINLIRSES